MEDDSSVQSWVPIRLSSLIMSSGNKLLSNKLEGIIYYYQEKVKRVQKELKKRSLKSKYSKIYSYINLMEFIHEKIFSKYNEFKELYNQILEELDQY